MTSNCIWIVLFVCVNISTLLSFAEITLIVLMKYKKFCYG